MYVILTMALKVGPIVPCVIEDTEVVEKLNNLPKLAH